MSKDAQKFDPAIIAACSKYSDAATLVGKAVANAELALWKRAAAGSAIKEAADKCNEDYIAAAMALCNVARSVIAMDVKAEEMRQQLRYKPADLPPNSVSAFYELHRARQTALQVAGENAEAVKAAEDKVKEVGKQIVKNNLSVRKVRAEFKEEYAAAPKKRNCKRPVMQEKAEAPSVQSMLADELKKFIDKVAVPDGLALPLVTVVPVEATAQAVNMYFADTKFREIIADACPTKGGLWIYVDLNQAQQLSKPANEESAVTQPKRKTNRAA